MIRQIQDEADTRKKNLYLIKRGKLFSKLYITLKRKDNEYTKKLSLNSVIKFKNVLIKIIDGK